MGLTGGVGSGKSTVAGLLTLHGAFLIDADQVAREVVGPKTPGLEAISDRFGPSFVTRAGELDRRKMAELVFSDKSALANLNAIVHPQVRVVIAERLQKLEAEDPDAVVVLMVPLLIESGAYATDVIVVVDLDPTVALERLVESRGWNAKEATARMSAQLSREDRNAKADYLIDNGGSLDDLRGRAAEAWQWLVGRRATNEPRKQGERHERS